MKYYLEICKEFTSKTSQFNCSIFVVKLHKSAIHNNLTNKFPVYENFTIVPDGDEDSAAECCGTELILKKGNAERKGQVKMEEINFLLRAHEARRNDIIVRIIGYCMPGVFDTTYEILMERAESNLFEYAFVAADNRLKKKELFGNSVERHVLFLKRVEHFFTSVLDFLRQNGIVYRDWKFENILCFQQGAQLKLADFGSILPAGVRVTNPKNCNQLYSSINYLHTKEEVEPRFEDDYVSVCYLFYKLNGLALPWENVIFLEKHNLHIDALLDAYVQIAYLKCCNVCHKSTKKVVYWPEKNNYFNFLNSYDFFSRSRQH